MQYFEDAQLEVKKLSDEGTFSGYASVFGTIDSENDSVLPGAFRGALKTRQDVKLLWQHDTAEPIGVITYLKEDRRGLYVEGRLLLSLQRAREAHALLKSGALDGLSIGYRVRDFTIDPGTGVRQLTDLDLLEISLVTFPANEDAIIMQVKSSDMPDDVRTFERFLRMSGFSRNRSKEIAVYGYRGKQADNADYSAVCLNEALNKALYSLCN